MIRILLAYLIIIFFFAAESRARKGREAKGLEQTPFDRGSTQGIGLAFLAAAVALLAAPLLDYFRIGRITINPVFAWAGVLAAMGGIALRFWANQTLGEFYTRRLRVASGQRQPGFRADELSRAFCEPRPSDRKSTGRPIATGGGAATVELPSCTEPSEAVLSAP